MGFSIDICRNTDNVMTVNKTNTTTIAPNVPIDPLSIISQLNPVFVVDYNAAYLNANYIICSFLNRKYFCTVSVDTAGRCVISCAVDYLSSFNLSNCPVHVLRNEKVGINKIPDSKLPIIPNEKEIVSTILKSNFFTKTESNSYLLSVIGGGTNGT